MATLITLNKHWMREGECAKAFAEDQPLLPLSVDPSTSDAYNCGQSAQPSEADMGSVSIRIDEELVAAARAAAKAEFRTVQGQLEFWAKVGRAALDNPDLSASFIAESLISMGEPRDDSVQFVPRNARKA